VAPEKAVKLNAVHGPSLSRALNAVRGERVTEPMPADATVLIPRDTRSYAATGERIAVLGKHLLHERTGDPDMSDSWRHYVVRIDDPDLVRRAGAFIKRAR
jgi:hypothetical protein